MNQMKCAAFLRTQLQFEHGKYKIKINFWPFMRPKQQKKVHNTECILHIPLHCLYNQSLPLVKPIHSMANNQPNPYS